MANRYAARPGRPSYQDFVNRPENEKIWCRYPQGMNLPAGVSYIWCNDPPSLGAVECREVHGTFFMRRWGWSCGVPAEGYIQSRPTMDCRHRGLADGATARGVTHPKDGRMGTPHAVLIRRFIPTAALFAVFASGCNSHNKRADAPATETARQNQHQQAPALRGDSQRRETNDETSDSSAAGPATADLLARRTASYSRDLEQLLKKQSRGTDAQAGQSAPQGKESNVRWETPDQKQSVAAADPGRWLCP